MLERNRMMTDMDVYAWQHCLQTLANACRLCEDSQHSEAQCIACTCRQILRVALTRGNQYDVKTASQMTTQKRPVSNIRKRKSKNI